MHSYYSIRTWDVIVSVVLTQVCAASIPQPLVPESAELTHRIDGSFPDTLVRVLHHTHTHTHTHSEVPEMVAQLLVHLSEGICFSETVVNVLHKPWPREREGES